MISTPISLVALGAGAGLFDGFLATQQGHAAAGQNAFFDGRTRGVQGVFDAGLLLLHVGFARSADRNDRDAAGELRQPLLQLLAIVVAVGAFDLPLRICSIRFWIVVLLAGALDDRGVVLGRP